MTPSTQPRRARAKLRTALAVTTCAAALLTSAVSAAASGHVASRSGGRTLGTLPRVLVGNAPQDSVFDPVTHTVYVANQGDNTMSVVNARTCNARDTAGCARAAPAFPAGNGPFGISINNATHTVYIADGNSDTVSVFNTATCNAADTAGCKRITATVKVGEGPASVAVDPVTDTLYVTNAGAGISGTGGTVSVINGATCNATNTSGCARKPATVTVGHFAFTAAFDAE